MVFRWFWAYFGPIFIDFLSGFRHRELLRGGESSGESESSEGSTSESSEGEDACLRI